MTGWLVDTNVISELRRPRPDPRVVAFMATQPLESLHVSVVTVAEIRFGIERQADAVVRVELADWLAQRVRPLFGERVLPLSEDALLRWRLLEEEGRRSGHTWPQPDLLIAATALQYGLTVVTRDVKGFVRARVPVLDPWEQSS